LSVPGEDQNRLHSPAFFRNINPPAECELVNSGSTFHVSWKLRSTESCRFSQVTFTTKVYGDTDDLNCDRPIPVHTNQKMTRGAPYGLVPRESCLTLTLPRS